MSKASTKPPSGTRDFLPADVARRRFVIRVIEAVYEAAGFVPLETPAFENLSTLLDKYGDEGDQLLFRLLHRRETLQRALDRDEISESDLANLGLRYDLTVPLARVIARHRDLPRFFKRYQIQPVWRADRPGRGRFREFYQCDVDVVGTASAIAEAEVAGAVAQVLRRLGFTDFVMHLNHREVLRALVDAAGIPSELEGTALVALDKLDKIGRDRVLGELEARGVTPAAGAQLLGLLDEAEDDPLDRLGAALTTDRGRGALDELRALRDLLGATPAADHVRIAPALARGLSYYTGPIFEFTVPDLAGSLGGGGRYDNLIGMFGKEPIPAVGCSLGLERVLLVMTEREMYPALPLGPQVMLCGLGIADADALKIAYALRAQGVRVEVYPQSAKLGKQLKYADNAGAIAAAIVGEDELAAGEVTLKFLASGEQRRVPIGDVARTL